MIRKYVLNFKPDAAREEMLPTGAVVRQIEAAQGELPYVQQREGSLFVRLDEEDIVYGLGENVRGINKRGWIYESNCSDDPHHIENAHSLYGAHNFLIIDGPGKCFGLFLDTPGKVTFDIGYTRLDELVITPEAAAAELYIIDEDPGESASADGIVYCHDAGSGISAPETIVHQLRTLTGRSYVPPKWAFGFGQSRWSYFTADEVREVAKGYRENHLPIDMIYLDIDYMERYKDFTIDRERFPDFEELVEEMRAQGIRLIPIIDAGVRVEEGYDVYEEGVKNGYFCTDENGDPFVVGVWPGKCHFPDMLNDDARRWFGRKYSVLLEKGIEGFWNDMNEPAIFYSQKRLDKILGKMETLRGKNLDLDAYFAFQEDVSGLANSPEDYRSFYHQFQGKRVRHDKVHNLFGYYMTRSAAEAFEELEPDKRILIFSRASYIGMHRYAGIWMGDNCSWWSHLLLNLKMLPSLNMCGFLYTGADIGGFGADTTEDLLLRWLALGIFMPLMRDHAANGTRRQEAYAFADTDAFRGILGLRYRLLPYLYSEYMKAALRDEMYARPLGFVWREDPLARRTEDQMMIGESIMIAPVYEQNAAGRMVYLPEEMKLIRFAGTEITEEKILPAGHHYIPVGLDEVVIFLRGGHILPLAKGGECVAQVDWEDLQLLAFRPEEGSGNGSGSEALTYELYNDDGESRSVSLEGHIRVLEG